MQRNEFSRSFLKSRVNNSTLLKCLLVIPALNFPFFFPVGIANGPVPKLNFWLLAALLCTSEWRFSSSHVRGCRFLYISCILDVCGFTVAAPVWQHVLRCNDHPGKINLAFTSLPVPFQMSSSLTSLPPRHLKLRFRPFHCFDTHKLLFKSSLRGKSGPTAHPGSSSESERTILYTGLFRAVRTIFPSIGRRNKRGRVQSALKGPREPICDFSLPARTGNEGDGFAIRKFSPSFRIRGLNFPKTHLIHSPLLEGYLVLTPLNIDLHAHRHAASPRFSIRCL